MLVQQEYTLVGPPQHSRSSFKSPINLGGRGATTNSGICSQIKISSVPLSDTLSSSSAISFIESLFAMLRLPFKAPYFTLSVPFQSHSQQLPSSPPHSLGTTGGSSTSAFSCAARSKPSSIIKSLGGNRAPKILTRFNFHIPAPVIKIICNDSLVSPDTTVKNNKTTSAPNNFFLISASEMITNGCPK